MFAKPADVNDRPQGLAADLHRHLVYGLAVESAFPLLSFEERPEAAAPSAMRLVLESPAFFRRRTSGVALDPDDWIQHAVLPDGAVYMKLQGIFETIVAANGASVACARQGDVDWRSFEANLLNFVMSTALTLRGEEPLHATVLDFEGRVFGLLGPSGAGKSTLAAGLIRRGADLITDDMLRLDFEGGRALAHYGPHRLKLLDEPARLLLPQAMAAGHFNALNGKIMVQPPATLAPRRRPRPIDALFWLGEAPPGSDEVTVRQLAGIDLARALTASAMNIRYFAPDRLTRQFRFAERVARTVPVHTLAYPRRYALLDRVIAEIRRAAAC